MYIVHKDKLDLEKLQNIYLDLVNNHKYIKLKDEEYSSEPSDFEKRYKLYLRGFNSIKTEVAFPPLERYLSIILNDDEVTAGFAYQTIKGCSVELFYNEIDIAINQGKIDFERLTEINNEILSELEPAIEKVKPTITDKVKSLIKKSR